MQHNWYYNELRQKLADLKKKRGSATGEELKLINDTIKLIEDLLKYRKNRFITPEELLQMDYFHMKPTSFLWSEIRNFAKLASDEDILGKNDFPFIKLSNKDLIDLVHNFYKNGTNPKTYDIFMHFFKDRRKDLHFMNEKDFRADVVYLPYYKKAYIQVNLAHDFADIPYTVHEYGHCIQFFLNYDNSLFNGAFYEVVSTFFELISSDYYIKNGIFAKEGVIHLLEDWDQQTEVADDLSREFDILDAVSINSNDNKIQLVKNIRNYMSLFGPRVTELLETEPLPSEDYIYIVAELIAIELFWIYLTDPDFAFYLLYKIIDINPKLPQDEYYRQIQNLGINLNEHTKDYQEYLKRKLPK